MQEFADKLIFCQEHDVQVTINMVMVPDWFERDWENALFFHEQGINVTLKPQSDPTASFVVDGYTEAQLAKLHNGMPQRAYTESKRKWADLPKLILRNGVSLIQKKLYLHFQKWKIVRAINIIWIAERFHAFNFNKFKGWNCNAGYPYNYT